MNFKEIIKLVEQDMSEVNELIHQYLGSEIIIINKFVDYMFTGGKRIRPILAILVAKALNYTKKQHIIIAVLIEFIHTATLLHDDVVDNSKQRRGKVASNILYGNSASVLVGDFIYTRAFQIMMTLKSLKILSLISKAVNVIAEGEIFQLMYRNNPELSIENYMKIIYSKTARLFEVTSQSSAILAGADFKQEVALRNYGRYLGVAFQLIDDILDYTGDSSVAGKEIGIDFSEGKLTLPLIHAIHHSNIVQNLLIRKAMKNKGSNNLFKDVIDIMNQCGSLEYAHGCAKKEVDKAISCLDILSPSPYRNALESVANLVVNYHL